MKILLMERRLQSAEMSEPAPAFVFSRDSGHCRMLLQTEVCAPRHVTQDTIGHFCSLKAAFRENGARGFTMIEIAISLAIIGFALVAIIGILPAGLNAQRDNRQETIVNQDASILMDAVRNGERGLDDLTNYVVSITNYLTDFTPAGNSGPLTQFGYTLQVSTKNGAPTSPQFRLTNGFNIIGLLSTPKIVVHPSGRGYTSNHVVAIFRSMSGPASEKPPQANPIMQDLALTYRVIADVSDYNTNYYNPGWTNFSGLSTNDIAYTSRSNYMILVRNFQTNLHDLRLTFLWPMLPNGVLPERHNRQIYRTTVAGRLLQPNVGAVASGGLPASNDPFWLFQPRTFF